MSSLALFTPLLIVQFFSNLSSFLTPSPDFLSYQEACDSLPDALLVSYLTCSRPVSTQSQRDLCVATGCLPTLSSASTSLQMAFA